MTVSPSNPEEEALALTPAAAGDIFQAARRLSEGEDTALAIVDAAGRVVYASEAAERVFEAESSRAIQSRLLAGHGPTARRLRRLAAEAPVDAPRLEQFRFAIGRRAVTLNLRCTGLTGQGGTYLVLSAPGPARVGDPPAVAFAEATPSPLPAMRQSRFFWTLDAGGAFGPADPLIESALGANAPLQGETVADLMLRADIGNGAGLARALSTRETFANLAVLWPAAEFGARARITLSGSPVFDRERAFAGYCGFGCVGETTAAAESAIQEPPVTEVEVAETTSPTSSQPPESGAPMAPSGESQTNGTGSVRASPEESAKADEPSAVEPPPPAPSLERTAEIYVLRQSSLSAAKVVPIRPGALDGAPPDGAQAASDGVELNRSEREAFREIARALIGRSPLSRDEKTADARAAPQPAAAAKAFSSSPPLSEKATAAAEPAPALHRNASAILDRLPIGVLVVRDARALYANHTLLALVGYRDFAHFESAGGLTAMFRGRDPNDFSQDAALAVVRSDGRPVAVDGRAQAIAWDDAPATLIALRRAGEQANANGAAKPQAQARNGAAAEELQEMLDHAADGAATLDLAGRIQSLNAPAERLFGYAEAEVAGESLLMLLAPQSHPDATARLEHLSQFAESARASRAVAVAGRARNGDAIELALTLARIGPAEAPQFCALFRNLSAEREAERRLIVARDAALAASAAKTDFLAHVSHEIRTPLHAILGFAEVMMEERFGPIGNERYSDYLKDIHASGRHVMSLADDLLDLSKIETGKLELAFAPVDANNVIRECVSLMQPQAARERIIMRVSLFDQLPRVIADERSLRQIMLNLMSNAVKFNEPGGQVIVSTAVDATGQAVIRVRDTGVGMNESEVGVALEPFGRIGRSGHKAGAGLGLPLTKALVEANKAEFSIKSRREQGTLIEIAFPVVQAAE